MYSCTPFFFFVHMCIYYVFLYPVFLNNLYQMIKKWGTKIHSADKFGTFGNPIVGNPLGAPPREFLRSMCVCVPVSVALRVPLPLPVYVPLSVSINIDTDMNIRILVNVNMNVNVNVNLLHIDTLYVQYIGI